ncbi:hypothetical protein [Bradyrhizobium erythrophlei]|uniref:Uncharacterized protein n=1 Tax=Bradyrhizobium erythrophlei TaxID=1437360 RepID=A0A1H5JDG2_9BRAD|nr:hypothetical protein [Bradyrhizobium erythrophlei]SEE50267.1 hypothetical protein SAMN05444164_8371 [Bradyrhizobium erythrophlei]
MAWTWRWWVFLGLLIPAVIAAAMAQQSMNNRNVASLGKGDFLYALTTRPGATVTGTLVVGATYSAIITAVTGFIL